MIDEMCKILERLQLYVPAVLSQTSVTLLNREVYKMTTAEILEMLFTGELLRARSIGPVMILHDIACL
jgi:hypothetical protein